MRGDLGADEREEMGKLTRNARALGSDPTITPTISPNHNPSTHLGHSICRHILVVHPDGTVYHADPLHVERGFVLPRRRLERDERAK